MSNKIVVNTGKSYFAKICVTGGAGNKYINTYVQAHLYVNSYTPVSTSVLSNFTELTAGSVPGYAPQTLTGATDGGIDANNWDTWTFTTLTFQATGGPPVPYPCYGAFFTDPTGAILLWAELFPSVFTFTNNGDGFTLIPTMSVGSIFGNTP